MFTHGRATVIWNQLFAVNQVAPVNTAVMISRRFFVHGSATRDLKNLQIRGERIEAPNDAANKFGDSRIPVHNVPPEGEHCGV